MYEKIKMVGVADEFFNNVSLKEKLLSLYPGICVIGMEELIEREKNKERGMAILADKDLADKDMAEILGKMSGLVAVIKETDSGFSQNWLLKPGKIEKSFVFPAGMFTT